MSRIEELEKRLAADPNSRIFVQLAEEYRKQGLLENAIEVCEQGLEKHPKYPSARVALGRALLEAESYDRASEQFEAVLAQVPDNILANKFLGETYHRLGRYDDAIQKYQIAQTLAPEDTELEGKIEAVKAEMAAGGPPAPAEPAEPADQAGTPPPPPPAGEAPLEPTLADSPAAPPQTSPEPPPMPGPPPAAPPPPIPESPETSAAPPPPPPQAGEEDPPAPPPDELAPIPLVDVDEPMVLESPAESYARASERPTEEAAAEPEDAPEDAVPVPLMSPSEPPPMPPPFEPPSVEPPPADATPMEPPPPEPPPPAVETPPVVEAAPEPPPMEATPVEPIPFEPSAQPPTPPTPSPPEGDIDTPTMAELYATQGHFDKAVAVYRNLLARDPNATQYLERIEELEMLAKASADSAPAARLEARDSAKSDSGTRQTIDVLERWLEEIRRSRRA